MEQSIFLSNFLLPLAVSVIVSVVTSRLTYRNEARKEFPKIRVEAVSENELKGKEIYRFSIETPAIDPEIDSGEQRQREPYLRCSKERISDVTKNDIALSFICFAEGDFELKRIMKLTKRYEFKNTPLPVLDLLNSKIVIVISRDDLPIRIDGLFRGMPRIYDIPSYTADTFIQGKSQIVKSPKQKK